VAHVNAKVAIIPARGGSVRLPKKNKLPFLGLPMLAHTVCAAAQSRIFSEIIFSSDDPEMVEIAAGYGVTAILRPGELARPETEFYPVILHALETAGVRGPADICLLMPNCPLRTAADIAASAAAFAQGSPFQLSVFRYHMFNPCWALAEGHSGLTPLFPGAFANPGGLGTPWCPSGAIWWAELEAYRAARDFYGPGVRGFELPWFRAMDIDTAEDLRMATIIAAAMRSNPELFE